MAPRQQDLDERVARRPLAASEPGADLGDDLGPYVDLLAQPAPHLVGQGRDRSFGGHTQSVDRCTTRLERRPAEGEDDDPVRAGGPERLRRGCGRGAGRDHVVDEEHLALDAPPRGERGRAPSLGGGASGLRRPWGADERAAAGRSEVPRDPPRQQLGVVEAALAAADVGGRRPRDDVGPTGHEHGGRGGEAREGGPVAPVLQAGDQLPPGALVREQHVARVDTGWRREERGGAELARAPGAGRRAAGTAHGAGRRQEHPCRFAVGCDALLPCAAVTSPDVPQTDDRSTAAAAWLVTLVITAGLIATVIIFAFSQHNTPASIDGRTATTSQFIEGE